MKKTSLLLYLAFSFCGSISFAQQALTPEVLQTLKESYSHDDAHKAIRNAGGNSKTHKAEKRKQDV